MAKIITIINSKGGVSKTTSALNIGACMASKGLGILLIDTDAQCNLTHILCGKRYQGQSLYDVLLNGGDMPIVSVSPNLHIIPGDISMANIERDIAPSNHLLNDVLQPHIEQYDYIIIDCPPALNTITYNAIHASDFILIPMLGEYLSLEGTETIDDMIQAINTATHTNKSIGGIFFSRFKENRGMDRTIKQLAIDRYGDKVMNTYIHENVALSESTIAHCSIYTYKPKSRGAYDYTALTDELIHKINHQ